METASTIFYLPENRDVDQVLQHLEHVYAVQRLGGEQSEQLRVLDTFDWRLFRQGYVLTRKGLHYRLTKIEGEEICVEKGSRKRRPFWWDFPAGSLQESLKSLAGIRVLLPQFTLHRTHLAYRVLNSDRKTILRLWAIQSRVESDEATGPLPHSLHVQSLRGYRKPYKRMCTLLRRQGLNERDAQQAEVCQAQHVLDIDPSRFRAKFYVALDRDETVGQAVRDICLALEATMLHNLPGVLQDLDSEFLHDFRVAVRRTRSLLSLLKKHLPAKETQHFQAEFKWLGSITGQVRDLDVYLLQTEEYQSMLPESLQPGLGYFFEDLARQKKKELRLLEKNLSLDRFARLLGEWQQFLNSLPSREDFPAGKKLCRKVAERIIRKRFKRILSHGRQVQANTPDAALHELRIEAKKFRYLLEFFRSLFRHQEVEAYLRQLKKLQNNLGDFNDLSIQQEMLVSYKANLAGDSGDVAEVAASLGGLIVHLAQEQRLVRTKFEQTFGQFASAENVALLEAIFAPSETVIAAKRISGK